MVGEGDGGRRGKKKTSRYPAKIDEPKNLNELYNVLTCGWLI